MINCARNEIKTTATDRLRLHVMIMKIHPLKFFVLERIFIFSLSSGHDFRIINQRNMILCPGEHDFFSFSKFFIFYSSCTREINPILVKYKQ